MNKPPRTSPGALILVVLGLMLVAGIAVAAAWYYQNRTNDPQLNGDNAILEVTYTPAGKVYTIRHDHHDWVIGYNMGIVHHPDCRCGRHYPDDRWRDTPDTEPDPYGAPGDPAEDNDEHEHL